MSSRSPFEPLPLPMADAPPAERADAARNREAILVAADRVIARAGVAGLTMEDVAREAGLGKGTVFRRFESRSGLMAAILDRTERAWQQHVMSGPPPLGPGAPARDRLIEFGHSRIRRNVDMAALLRAGADRRSGRSMAPLAFVTTHLRYLLSQLDLEGDLDVLAIQLTAATDPNVVVQLTELGLSAAGLDRSWDELIGRIVPAE